MKKWFSDTWQSIKDSAREKWNGIKGSIMSVAGPLITGIKNAFYMLLLSERPYGII